MTGFQVNMRAAALGGVILGLFLFGCDWDGGRADGGRTRQIQKPAQEIPLVEVQKAAVDEMENELVDWKVEEASGPPGPVASSQVSQVPVAEFAFAHVDREPTDHLTLAQNKLGEKDRVGALLELQKALYDDPANYSAAMLLGQVAQKSERKELAIDAFRLAGQIDSDADDPWLQLGRIYLSQKDYDQSEQLVRTALRLNPKRALSHNVLGRIWLNRSHWDRAILSFQKALELNPSNKYYRNNLGFAQLLKKDFNRSVEVLKPLAEQSDLPAFMHNNLGLAYEGAGQLQQATVQFKRALEVKPRYVNARINLDRLVQLAKRSESLELERSAEAMDEEPFELSEQSVEEELLIPEAEEL